MKNINTLVEDIYAIIDTANPTVEEKKVDEFIEIFGESLKKQIKIFLYEKGDRPKNLRLSGIGKPDRQLWYDLNLKSNRPNLSPDTKIKFLYGHMLEELLLFLCSVAGHKVEHKQKELVVEGIKGHQDAFIDGVLVDCKSTSNRGFDKFKRNSVSSDDPFGYIPQISAYAEANNVDEAAFLVINKLNGEICLSTVHSMEMINAKDRIKYLKGVVEKDSPPGKCFPDVPDGKSGNYRLDITCVYCPHKFICWSDANDGKGLRSFKYAKGTRHLTKVGKTPDVEEITTD